MSTGQIVRCPKSDIRDTFLFRIYEILFRNYEITFSNYEITFRKNELLFLLKGIIIS